MGFIDLDARETFAERRRRQRRQMGDFMGGIPPAFWYWLIILLGLVMIGFGLLQCVDYFESRNWAAVTGKIVDSRITSETRTESTRSGTRTYTYYKALISYNYMVNGRTYVSDRVRLSEKMCILSLCASDTRAATDTTGPQERVNQYPLNTPVVVRYNPTNPQEAVLERNLSIFIYFALGMGALMLVMGVGLLSLPSSASRMSPEEEFWESKRTLKRS